MRSALAAMLFTTLLSGVALADGRFRNMMPYAEAREMFQRMGYRPFMMPGADICDSDDPRCYPELEYCAKSRTWACTYTWRRGKSIIQVETRYANPVVARSECVINCAQVPPKAGRLLEDGLALR